MSDLVERLRDWSDGPETSALCEAAADRIEQLERVIAQAREAQARIVGAFQSGHSPETRANCWAQVKQSIAAIDEALK